MPDLAPRVLIAVLLAPGLAHPAAGRSPFGLTAASLAHRVPWRARGSA